MRTTCLTTALCLFALPLQAESLCGWGDEAEVLAALAGPWQQVGAVSVETQSASLIDGIMVPATIAVDGTFNAEPFDAWAPNGLALGLLEVPLDVDRVDDLLDTVEAAWIADAVSTTPCGPEDLPQLSVEIGDGLSPTGQVTLVPYFTDQVVLLSEVEMRGDWGIAFVTIGALLTPLR